MQVRNNLYTTSNPSPTFFSLNSSPKVRAGRPRCSSEKRKKNKQVKNKLKGTLVTKLSCGETACQNTGHALYSYTYKGQYACDVYLQHILVRKRSSKCKHVHKYRSQYTDVHRLTRAHIHSCSDPLIHLLHFARNISDHTWQTGGVVALVAGEVCIHTVTWSQKFVYKSCHAGPQGEPRGTEWQY